MQTAAQGLRLYPALITTLKLLVIMPYVSCYNETTGFLKALKNGATCAVQGSGTYPDSDDCRFYFHCSKGSLTYLFKCPPELVFSAAQSKCVFGSGCESLNLPDKKTKDDTLRRDFITNEVKQRNRTNYSELQQNLTSASSSGDNNNVAAALISRKTGPGIGFGNGSQSGPENRKIQVLAKGKQQVVVVVPNNKVSIRVKLPEDDKERYRNGTLDEEGTGKDDLITGSRNVVRFEYPEKGQNGDIATTAPSNDYDENDNFSHLFQDTPIASDDQQTTIVTESGEGAPGHPGRLAVAKGVTTSETVPKTSKKKGPATPALGTRNSTIGDAKKILAEVLSGGVGAKKSPAKQVKVVKVVLKSVLTTTSKTTPTSTEAKPTPTAAVETDQSETTDAVTDSENSQTETTENGNSQSDLTTTAILATTGGATTKKATRKTSSTHAVGNSSRLKRTTARSKIIKGTTVSAGAQSSSSSEASDVAKIVSKNGSRKGQKLPHKVAPKKPRKSSEEDYDTENDDAAESSEDNEEDSEEEKAGNSSENSSETETDDESSSSSENENESSEGNDQSEEGDVSSSANQNPAKTRAARRGTRPVTTTKAGLIKKATTKKSPKSGSTAKGVRVQRTTGFTSIVGFTTTTEEFSEVTEDPPPEASEKSVAPPPPRKSQTSAEIALQGDKPEDREPDFFDNVKLNGTFFLREADSCQAVAIDCRGRPKTLEPDETTTLRECLNHFCMNGGMYFVGSDGQQCGCICKPGFHGIHCQLEQLINKSTDADVKLDAITDLKQDTVMDAAACKCKNGGECVELLSHEVLCRCPLGFLGSHCEHPLSDINPVAGELVQVPPEVNPKLIATDLASEILCATNVCVNGGICARNLKTNSQNCYCRSGFGGAFCETALVRLG